MKICTKCKIEQSKSEFGKHLLGKEGLHPHCRSCIKEQSRLYRKNNPEKRKETCRRWDLFNKEKITAKRKQWYLDNPDYNKQYYKDNKERMDAEGKQYRQNNKEKIKCMKKQWVKNNQSKVNKRAKDYARERRQTDLGFKITCALRSRLNHALRGNFKSGSAVRDLDCSIPELKQWLEQQFYNRKDGTKMTWKDWSKDGWHIDHIIPLDSFNLSDRKQLKKAVHWFNLQPLWVEDNLRKSNKIDLKSLLERSR